MRDVTTVYETVMARSGGRCEAVVWVNGRPARCGRGRVQIHHMLKRSRGGQLLDKVGETYHLAVLCHYHHQYAETSGEDTGLLIDGYAIQVKGEVHYTGSDEYLREKYGYDSSDAGDDPDGDAASEARGSAQAAEREREVPAVQSGAEGAAVPDQHDSAEGAG